MTPRSIFLSISQTTANGIQPYNDAPARFDDGIDYIFRVAPTSTMVSRTTVDRLASLGVEDVVIVAENTDYGIGASESDQAFIEELGMRHRARRWH